MAITIITHPGSAHFDDFMALSLIVASQPESEFIIERREPTQAELDDASVWVVDVGGRHEPDKLNFDHHQDRDCPASFVIVAEHLGLAEDFKRLPWWTYRDLNDRIGPRQAALKLGFEDSIMTVSPVERWLLKRFERAPQACVELLRDFGREQISYVRHLASQLAFWATCEVVEVKGRRVLVGDTDDSLGLEEFRAGMAEPADVAVSHDKRGGGWRLYRFDDNDRSIDFSRVTGDSRIKFAHKTGFTAKTMPEVCLDEALELVGLSLS